MLDSSIQISSHVFSILALVKPECAWFKPLRLLYQENQDWYRAVMSSNWMRNVPKKSTFAYFINPVYKPADNASQLLRRWDEWILRDWIKIFLLLSSHLRPNCHFENFFYLKLDFLASLRIYELNSLILSRFLLVLRITEYESYLNR